MIDFFWRFGDNEINHKATSLTLLLRVGSELTSVLAMMTAPLKNNIYIKQAWKLSPQFREK